MNSLSEYLQIDTGYLFFKIVESWNRLPAALFFHFFSAFSIQTYAEFYSASVGSRNEYIKR
jgi:hypothetical protein